tara:strand:+ start:843 stop:1031 length:189 start_codon:yes stop_codon:yes gene_type:complete
VARAKTKQTRKIGKVYLVRHIPNPDNGEISQVGPFHSQKEAINTCLLFLKKGTCSWVAKCDG